MNKTEDFISLIQGAFQKGVIKKLVFSRPKSSDIKRVSGRLAEHKGRRLLALEYSLPENTVSHKNLTEDALYTALSELLLEYSQANLITTLGFIWAGILIFFGMMVTHDYSMFKNVLTTAGTIVGMIFIMFVGILFTTLLGKVFSFITNIVTELSYRA